MKKLLRHFLINLIALWVTATILPAFIYEGGLKTLVIGVMVFMVINILALPLIKVMLLPLNILTLGLFSWLANVVGLFLLTKILPEFKLIPYSFEGLVLGGFVIPPSQLNILQVAIIASFLVGVVTNFLKWMLD